VVVSAGARVGVEALCPWVVVVPTSGPPLSAMGFVEFARYYLEAASGGNGSWTAG
jgi:hypothetical protein